MLGLPKSSVPMECDKGNREGNVIDRMLREKRPESRAAEVMHSSDCNVDASHRNMKLFIQFSLEEF